MLSQAEMAVIGCVLINPKLAPKFRSWLTAEDFESTEGRDLYNYIVSDGKLDPVIYGPKLGHDVFYAECVKLTPTTANFDEYLRIFVDEARKRKLRMLSDTISTMAFDSVTSSDDIVAELSNRMDDLKVGRATMVKSSADMESEWADHYDNAKRDPEAGWCQSGYTLLDISLGNGFLKSGFYIIGARPGMGKTTFALNIADRITKKGNAVLFASLEMSSKQIMAKRIAIASRVPYSGLLNGRLDDDKEALAAKTAVELAYRPFYILDRAAATVADIEAAALQIEGIKCIFIDYIGIVRTSNPDKKIYEAVSEISRDMKAMAMRLDVPVVCLCQLNRDSVKRGDNKPTLSDLRDSGAIEQDADGVLLLHRADYFERDPNDKPKKIEVIIAKNRHGSSNNSILYGWRAECGEITETEDDDNQTPWE